MPTPSPRQSALADDATAIPAGRADERWTALAAAVRACTLCPLHATRTQTVFGVGRRDAQLLVIGEAPGADEDRQGEPFVGRAGQLLNAMLHRVRRRARGCLHSPHSETSSAEQSRSASRGGLHAALLTWISRLRSIAPRVILAVGRIAGQWLLQSDAPIGGRRGKVYHYGPSRTPLVITYHPAYLLRSPLAKATAWQDLCMVKDLLSD